MENTQSNNEAIELGFPRQVHRFRIDYSYYQMDTTKAWVRGEDTFCCEAPNWAEAVNLWIDHCGAEGMKSMQIEDYSEDTKNRRESDVDVP